MSTASEIDLSDLEMLSFAPRDTVEELVQSSHSFQEFKDRAEAAFIKHQLKLHNWNVTKTADALQMERSHLYTKIKKYGLEREGKIEE
jgi:DNA-binding NtrC family response regulator